MKPTIRPLAVLLSVLLITGCIVGDELTTLTVHPDGSADLIMFRSNLRSTQKGDRAEAELADYHTKFDARTDNEFTRIAEAGGRLVDALWIRDQAPYSNAIHAQFPTASTLEKYCTMKNDDGSSLLTAHFSTDGPRRKLTLQIMLPPEKIDLAELSPSDVDQLRQHYADGISHMRIAVTDGSITAAQGFTVAADKQSALLNVSELAQLLQKGQGQAEAYLAWDVTQ
jgi:hypothetical protein